MSVLKTKQCTSCNEYKELQDFYSNASSCKICERKRARLYRRTEKGCLVQMYNHQREASERKGYPGPNYSYKEFSDWAYSNNYKQMYENWVKQGYRKNYIPSGDRLDDYKPYTLDNLRLVTWKVNHHKPKPKQFKPVMAYTLRGMYFKTYPSVTEAANALSGEPSPITACCKGKRESAYGYQWRYRTKRGMPIQNIGATSHSKGRSIDKRSMDGELLATYDTLESIQRDLGYSKSNVSKVCKGERASAYGFIWQYSDIPYQHDGYNPRDRKGKMIIQCNLDGSFIKKWKSIGSAARELGFNKANISGCCNGKRVTAHRYKWKWLAERYS